MGALSHYYLFNNNLCYNWHCLSGYYKLIFDVGGFLCRLHCDILSRTVVFKAFSREVGFTEKGHSASCNTDTSGNGTDSGIYIAILGNWYNSVGFQLSV